MTKGSVFQLIDLDRVLFDTSKFVKALTDEIDSMQPGAGAELDTRFEEAYTKEETFFLLRQLRKEKGDVWFESLVRIVATKYGPDAFAIAGMKERLVFADTLCEESPAWGIFTYGDEIDQHMKLRLVGLQDAPVCFTQTPDKAEIIRSWQLEDGRFQLPEVFGGRVVDAIVFEDDKLRAFQDLPQPALGLWVAAPGKQDHGKDIELPSNVIAVQDLFQSIEVLKTKFL